MTTLGHRQHGRRRGVVWASLLLMLALVLVVMTWTHSRPRRGDPKAGSPSAGPTATPALKATVPPAAPGALTGTPSTGRGGTGPLAAGSGTVTGDPRSTAGLTAAGRGFTMTATLTGGPLAIGARRTLRIAVHNRADRPIRLLGVDVTPQRPSAVGCRPSWLHVGRYRAGSGRGMLVAAGQTSHLDLPIGLVDLPTVDQDACKGAGFPLRLAGWGRRS